MGNKANFDKRHRGERDCARDFAIGMMNMPEFYSRCTRGLIMLIFTVRLEMTNTRGCRAFYWFVYFTWACARIIKLARFMASRFVSLSLIFRLF